MASFIPRLLAPALLGALIAACGSGEGKPADQARSPYDSDPPTDSHDVLPIDGRDVIPSGPDFSPTAGGGGNNNGQGQGGNNQAGTNGQGGNGESGSGNAGNGPGGGGDTSAKICDQCDNIVACFEGQVTLDQCKADCDGVSKACADCVKDAGTDCNTLFACQAQACK